MTKSSTISCASLSVISAVGKVALEIDVEEGRDPAERHRRAVLLLHSGEVAEIEPLDRLPGRLSPGRNVETIFRGHFLELAERADLFAQFLAIADDLVGRPLPVERGLLGLLVLDQAVDAIERNAAIIADDPPAAISVGQARSGYANCGSGGRRRCRRQRRRHCASCGIW